MQPTGGLHIGNWLGALRTWVGLLESGKDALFCVVDAHATTVDYEPSEMRGRIREVALAYVAAGLDPARCTLFVQSDVNEHMELAWYLATVTPMGELHRMTQFKEKSDQHKQNVNAGLFTYPILMAADVLLYKTTLVPVGDDQVQHLELAREVCRRFNARYGEVFPEPIPSLSETPRLLGLDGKSKMSKTRGNDIGLFEEPASLERKLRGAFTDPEKLRKGDPGHPERCNVFTLHKAVNTPARVAEIDRDCRSGVLGCGDCKRECAAVLNAALAPIRERGEALRGAPEQLDAILADGASRARAIARATMREVKDAMGLGVGGP